MTQAARPVFVVDPPKLELTLRRLAQAWEMYKPYAGDVEPALTLRV